MPVSAARPSFPYPLTGITFCAHCESNAQSRNDPRLRSKLTGKRSRSSPGRNPRYRHNAGVKCGVERRLVLCDVYESDFAQLIRLLTVKPEAMEIMTELAIEADRIRFRDDVDVEKQKREAIALG